MSRYVFDIETDNLLDKLTKVHSLVYKDIDHGYSVSCAIVNEGEIEAGLKALMEADLIVGHNIIEFDIPALQKVYPWFKPRGLVRDTLVLSRLIKADSQSHIDMDWKLANRGKMPKKMVGRHSLESWGYRLGNWKGDYAAIREAEAKAQGITDKEAITRYVWGFWNTDMQSYCEQDVEVTLDLWNHFQKILANGWSEESVDLEHETSWVIARQCAYGIGFDIKKAAKFLQTLKAHELRLVDELRATFADKVIEWTPKASNKKLGYVKGKPIKKVYPFNPGSDKQIAERLIALGWEPTEYGKNGVPTLDDETLELLPYPEAKKIAEYRLVKKRIGSLSTGKKSWMKNVGVDGVIHPEVTTNGAVTGRMTHRIVVNVPGEIDKKTGKKQLYGRECRDLFVPRMGAEVGCDADSLEGRVMGGYMAYYDGGAYIQSVIAGNKAEGTDNHSRTRDALNAALVKKYNLEVHRETAKTYFYALVYGARDPKLGETLGVAGRNKKQVGKASREAVMKGIPGLGQLIEALENKARTKGYIKGIDGRKLRIRAMHAILNTLFQSAGAIMMKRALIILDTELSGVKPSVIGTQGPEAATKLVPGKDYEFMINMHDEFQIDTREELAKEIGEKAAASIAQAGEYYRFRCPLKGNYDIGKSWAETH